MRTQKTIYHDIDTLVSYKRVSNRNAWYMLKKFGRLFILVDCYSDFFDIKLRSVEEGDIIISNNDGIEYIVLSVSKLEGTNLTRWINMQPLFSVQNWLSYDGLHINMKIDNKIKQGGK